MTRQLVLVHGRAQENKEAGALKAEWLESLEAGLAKSDLTLPIAEMDVRFPYYGDTLYDLAAGVTAAEAASVILKGEVAGDDEQRFMQAVLEEARRKAGLTDDELREMFGRTSVAKGPLDWGWVQDILRAIDRRVPFGSAGSLALATRDVYQYLRNAAIRETIDTGVIAAITPGVETVVVGHSLGSVVAYQLLRSQGHLRGWKVPLFVTVGSPLAVTEIRKVLKSVATLRVPECAGSWHNYLDERDIVALYALTPEHFPIAETGQTIRNRTHVRNVTANRHGISGYLDDREVARAIHDALVGG